MVYMISLWEAMLFEFGWNLAKVSDPFYQANGVAMLALALAPLALPLIAYLQERQAPANKYSAERF